MDTLTHRRLVTFIKHGGAIARRITYTELAKVVGIAITTRIIGRALHREGYYRRIVVSRPWRS